MTEILQVPRAGIGLGPHQRVGTADPAGGAATHHCLTVNKGLIWVNYNDLTATSLEIMVSKGNHPKMALFQVSELL